jgi:endonuclease/exonuclease/phosphatase family metal-dependent hydrolase
LGRAADRPGLDYWHDQIVSGVFTLENTRAAFTDPAQTEYTEIYGGLNNTQLVTAIYENFLERAPELAGLQYWVAELDNGRVNADQMINAVINAVQDPNATGEAAARDLATLENKIAAALYFVEKAQDISFDAEFRAAARAAVADVTDAIATLDQSKAMTDEYTLVVVINPDPISIATFNIQVFGNTKIGKPEVVAELAEIVRKYDIVAVQEIKNIEQTVPYTFLNAINQNGNYALVLGQRGGLQPDDANFKEQYAFYYNLDTIELMTDYGLFPDGDNDLFQREPLVARFQVLGGDFTFVLMTIHTSPSVAVEEIKALHEVFQWAQTVAGTEDDFIALGDFNQGCSYAEPSDFIGSPIATEYVYIVPDSADTNVSTSTQCAYDRIVITPNTDGEFTGVWGIDTVSDKSVSDHFPVWAEFIASEQ